jgi:hypothetical protein
VQGRDGVQRRKTGTDKWGQSSEREAGGERTDSGGGFAGPWAALAAGPIWSPRPFSYFIYFFSFSIF